MIEYPHIDSVYKRDEHGKFILGEYSQPEFEYLKDLPWVWTEKIDGTNIRVMYEGGEEEDLHNSARSIRKVTFGGKTNKAQIPTRLAEHLQETFPLEKMIEVFGDNDVCLYGEGYGAGIQKAGGLYSPTQKFILFDIRVGRWWLKRIDIEEIAEDLDIPIVPIVSWPSTLAAKIDAVAAGSPPLSSIGTAKVEGYVGIPAVPLLNRAGGRVITKVKYKDFL